MNSVIKLYLHYFYIIIKINSILILYLFEKISKAKD